MTSPAFSGGFPFVPQKNPQDAQPGKAQARQEQPGFPGQGTKGTGAGGYRNGIQPVQGGCFAVDLFQPLRGGVLLPADSSSVFQSAVRS